MQFLSIPFTTNNPKQQYTNQQPGFGVNPGCLFLINRLIGGVILRIAMSESLQSPGYRDDDIRQDVILVSPLHHYPRGIGMADLFHLGEFAGVGVHYEAADLYVGGHEGMVAYEVDGLVNGIHAVVKAVEP